MIDKTQIDTDQKISLILEEIWKCPVFAHMQMQMFKDSFWASQNAEC